MRTKKPINFRKYKIRVCRWLNHCEICGRAILSGDQYYDGGYGRRAHVECAKHAPKAQEEKGR